MSISIITNITNTIPHTPIPDNRSNLIIQHHGLMTPSSIHQKKLGRKKLHNPTLQSKKMTMETLDPEQLKKFGKGQRLIDRDAEFNVGRVAGTVLVEVGAGGAGGCGAGFGGS